MKWLELQESTLDALAKSDIPIKESDTDKKPDKNEDEVSLGDEWQMLLRRSVTILPTVCHGASFLFFLSFPLDYIINPWMA